MVNMNEIALFVGFMLGSLFTFAIAAIFGDENNLSKPQLEDYCKAIAERDYYKRAYDDLHFILEHLNDDDIGLCSKDYFNCFVIKKDKKKEDLIKELGFDE